MFYSDELVEEIRDRNDIVDVISSYVRLQKKGSSYFGLCPFHNEKSPSFSVSSDKQMYYCFGCGAGGNVITFLMEYENYNFKEALEVLAERAGIELPQQSLSVEAKANWDLKTRLLEMHKEAALYYYHLLKSEQGQIGYNYLTNRGLSEQTIRSFGLGYSSSYPNDLYQFLKGKGYKDSELKESGLVSISEKGVYDKFWNRVMFPIMDTNNRVIGFGGRVMGDGNPKYLNSPETKIFDKSRNLYGLNVAKKSKKGYFLICEGYMDVISLHQAGFTNAVASLGTAFTSGHALLLKRYTEQVILTYDSDEAGKRAALRAIPILKEVGIGVKVLNMKPYKDPDEFIKHLGAEEFEQRIKTAMNGFLFEIEVLKEQYEMNDPEQKTKFMTKVVEKLIEFSDELERNNYIDAVANYLMISGDALRKRVNELGNRGFYTQKKETKVTTAQRKKQDKVDGNKEAQRFILTRLSEDVSLYEKIKHIISEDDFVESLYRKVAQLLFLQLEENNVNPAKIMNHFLENEEEAKLVGAVFHQTLKEELSQEEKNKALKEAIIRIKKQHLEEASKQVQDISELQAIVEKQRQLKELSNFSL